MEPIQIKNVWRLFWVQDRGRLKWFPWAHQLLDPLYNDLLSCCCNHYTTASFMTLSDPNVWPFSAWGGDKHMEVTWWRVEHLGCLYPGQCGLHGNRYWHPTQGHPSWACWDALSWWSYEDNGGFDNSDVFMAMSRSLNGQGLQTHIRQRILWWHTGSNSSPVYFLHRNLQLMCQGDDCLSADGDYF